MRGQARAGYCDAGDGAGAEAALSAVPLSGGEGGEAQSWPAEAEAESPLLPLAPSQQASLPLSPGEAQGEPAVAEAESPLLPPALSAPVLPPALPPPASSPYSPLRSQVSFFSVASPASIPFIR